MKKILYLQVFSAKLGGHCKLLPASPLFSFAMLSQHRWMMRYLFWNRPPSKIICTIALVSFTQKRIERFPRSSSGCRVTRYSKRSYISHLFIAICTFRSPINLKEHFVMGTIVIFCCCEKYKNTPKDIVPIKNICVFIVFCQPLKHTKWFGEINWHWNFWQIFANTIFHDTP